jgi:hypothetical protein
MRNKTFIVLALLVVTASAAQGATKYVSISPTALLPMSSGIAAMGFAKWDSYFYFTATSSSYDDAFMYAPVNLPHNATITSLTVWYTRNTSDGDIYMSAYLHRQDLNTGTTTVVASKTILTTPASAARKTAYTTTIAYPTVANNRYSYALLVGFSRPMNLLKFNGARIGYTE